MINNLKEIETITIVLEGKNSDQVPEYQRAIIIDTANGNEYFSINIVPNGNKVAVSAMLDNTPPIIHDDNLYLNLNWAISYLKYRKDWKFSKLLTQLKKDISQRLKQGNGKTTISKIGTGLVIPDEIFQPALCPQIQH